MVGSAGGPVPTAGSGCSGCGGDPVELATGEFIYAKTDLALPDVLPIKFTRTYRTNDGVSRSFGIGATDNYDMYLTGDINPYTYMELILPDGNRVRFERSTPGTDASSAVYLDSSSPDEYYGATISWQATNNYGATWVLQKKDGTQIWFPESNSSNPRAEAPVHINDRYGNTLTLQRDSNNNLQQITSPNGRYIQFTYDASNRITQAKDNIGRTVVYNYDSQGRLYTVQDPNGGITTFTYDSNNNMLTVTNPRQIVAVQNQYDSSGRVLQQTLANQGTYLFNWTPTQNTGQMFVITNPGGGGDGATQGVLQFRTCAGCSEGYQPVISQVNVTDPRGYVRSVIFDPYGNTTNDIYALNQPEQQNYSYQHNADNTLASYTSPLAHQTVYTFDANLNLTQLEQLAETNSPVVTAYSYDPNFSQLASITDPLGHTTSLTIDSSGNTTQIIDPMNNTTTFTYNADGTKATTTDPLLNTRRYGYLSGDLVSITDPMNNQTTRFVDFGGRLLAVTDPVGHKTQYQYDNLNQVTQITDPLGNQTSFTYDPDGNLQTVTDALQHQTTYTYDDMDRVETRTDPLQRQESYGYDLGGNLQTFTDRKGQVTTYMYDGINRVTMAGFGTQNGQYASTINYTYDAGDQVTKAVDSISGTITRSYDGLERLANETTPQGSITYVPDAGGRRTSMQVGGQTLVSYTYDNANRLQQIQQGSTTIGFAYDNDSRPQTLTLPNGIVATYSYDSDSHLTEITYTLNSNSVGNLGYGYDVLGRRTSITGSFSGTGFPMAVAPATYDAANELTNWNGTAFGYDADGNMQSNGVHSYTWDTRNHLSSIDSGSTASFVYDPFGRRMTKSILGNTTSFLFDGQNPIQELSGTTPTANSLAGGIDQYFQRTDSAGPRNFLSDALGSTLVLTDSTGAVQTQYEYDPFGNTTTSGAVSTNSFQYTGRENDGTGIYFYRARYYAPSISRFISEDPMGFKSGLDFFVYVHNQPTTFGDPRGLYQLSGFSPQDAATMSIAIGQLAAKLMSQPCCLDPRFRNKIFNLLQPFGSGGTTFIYTPYLYADPGMVTCGQVTGYDWLTNEVDIAAAALHDPSCGCIPSTILHELVHLAGPLWNLPNEGPPDAAQASCFPSGCSLSAQ